MQTRDLGELEEMPFKRITGKGQLRSTNQFGEPAQEREQDPGSRLQALGLKHKSSYCKGKNLGAGEDPSHGIGVVVGYLPGLTLPFLCRPQPSLALERAQS